MTYHLALRLGLTIAIVLIAHTIFNLWDTVALELVKGL